MYRIVHKKYSGELNASGRSGRFNLEGMKVIYGADSVAVAMLENLVHRNGGSGFDDNFRIMVIYVPDTLSIERLTIGSLPPDWNEKLDYSKTQEIGSRWFNLQKTPVLEVPSVLVPQQSNYVINTLHPHFQDIKLIDTLPFVPDKRIDEIIKKYRSS